MTDSLRAIWGSRYLSLLTLLVVLSAVVNILVDYQFNFIVRDKIKGQDEMTAFLSAFAGYLAVFSFLIHLVLTSRIMRRFGLNFAIFVLPLAMLLGSTTLLFSAALAAGVVIKGLDGAFRHSIDRSSTELLYVPLPTRVKQLAKSFIDMVARRFGDGLAAVLLFLLLSVWRLSVQQISWANLAVLVPWLGVAWMLRREYVNTLRSSIERRDISAERLLDLSGSLSEQVTASLTSADEQAVETGLGWMQYGQSDLAFAQLASLLTHSSPTIRRKAIALVATKNVPECSAQVARFLYLDDDIESLWHALDYLERHDPKQSHVSLKELLEGSSPILRGTAAARLLARSDPSSRAKACEVLAEFLEWARGRESACRQGAAELLGLVPADLDCQAALADFLRDPDPGVVSAAILSAGRTRRRDLVPRLAELLENRGLRAKARRALAAFGNEILPVLNQSLQDPQSPLGLRRDLPRVFSSIGGQQAADLLAQSLAQTDPALQYQVLRALSRIRLNQPRVWFDASRITSLTLSELRRYYRYLTILRGIPQNAAGPGTRFLWRALNEQLDRKLENLFRLIGLLYPPKDILDAYHWITSGRRDLRANALEFLDSVLVNPLRQMLLPVIEDRSAERIIEFARSQLGIEQCSYKEALRELLTDSDPWLQSCAIKAAADHGLFELDRLLEPLLNADHPLLRETVQAARRRLRSSLDQAGASSSSASLPAATPPPAGTS